MITYFSNKDLLKTPGKRAAYSDRTAWLMAEMSRLAYFKFEGGSNIQEALNSVKELLPKKQSANLTRIEAILSTALAPTTAEQGRAMLEEILKPDGFELLDTFNDTGTGAQGFLCRHPQDKFAVLAFRGTEMTLKDIKADVKARLIEVEIRGKKVLMHSGYNSQFTSRGIQSKIEKWLSDAKLDGYQMFITGHSLGGALAITATKYLANDITGACYTFGSPPVGTVDFDRDIKTPIYRIINHVDIVPRLPNPSMVWVVRTLATLTIILLNVFGIFPGIKNWKWYKRAESWLADAQKYRQSGYGSYLVGAGTQAKLRYNVGIYDKFRWWFTQFRNFFVADFKLLNDHSIDQYSEKLAHWANDRTK